MQLVLLEVQQIQISNLQFVTRGWPQPSAKINDLIVVNIETRHRERAFRLPWLFFEADRSSVSVELDHAISFRVANLITKNVCATLDRERVAIEVELSVENVVA